MFVSVSVSHFHPKDGTLSAIYSYSHYNLLFSYIMITVLTSDENMLEVRTTVNLINYKILYNNATNNNNNSGNDLNPQLMFFFFFFFL